MRAAIVIAALALGATSAAADRPTPPDEPGPARILAVEADDDGAILTINRGSDRGLWKGWRGHLVDANGDVPNSDFTLTRVDQRASFARVALGSEALRARTDLRAALEPPPEPLTARVINIQIQGSTSVITINVGSDAGVASGWTGHVIGKHDRPLPGGTFTIVRVSKRSSVAFVKLTADVLEHYHQVIVEPPPPP